MNNKDCQEDYSGENVKGREVTRATRNDSDSRAVVEISMFWHHESRYYLHLSRGWLLY